MTHRSPTVDSVYGIEHFGRDAQREHAARLLLTGWDLEAAAMMSGLPLNQLRAIADGLTDEFRAAP